jgi:hypothetical protein
VEIDNTAFLASTKDGGDWPAPGLGRIAPEEAKRLYGPQSLSQYYGEEINT